jgi:hypothetical protein
MTPCLTALAGAMGRAFARHLASITRESPEQSGRQLTILRSEMEPKFSTGTKLVLFWSPIHLSIGPKSRDWPEALVKDRQWPSMVAADRDDWRM